MGTSKSNSGLRPNTPLLPDYAPPPDRDDAPGKEKKGGSSNSSSSEVADSPTTGNWSSAKAALTAVVRSSTRSERIGKIANAAKSYIRGSGGYSSMRRSAIGGKSVARNLGNVLVSVIVNGVNSALKEQGIDLQAGDSTEILFAKLAQQLSSKGGTVEETIANIAVVEALAYIYQELDLANNDISDLDNLSEDQAKEAIQIYISSYIFERWLHELGIKIESSDLRENQVIQLEYEIKDFITESVKLKFDGIDLKNVDFNKGHGKKIVNEIFGQAYKMIEAL